MFFRHGCLIALGGLGGGEALHEELNLVQIDIGRRDERFEDVPLSQGPVGLFNLGDEGLLSERLEDLEASPLSRSQQH